MIFAKRRKKWKFSNCSILSNYMQCLRYDYTFIKSKIELSHLNCWFVYIIYTYIKYIICYTLYNTFVFVYIKETQPFQFPVGAQPGSGSASHSTRQCVGAARETVGGALQFGVEHPGAQAATTRAIVTVSRSQEQEEWFSLTRKPFAQCASAE